jgi:hypothetical protein
MMKRKLAPRFAAIAAIWAPNVTRAGMATVGTW